MRRILIIQGHPDPVPARYCRALEAAYAEGAAAAGHSVERIDLARLDVPFLRSQVEFETSGVPPSLAGAAEAVQRAEHVVIIFPLWLGTMPALLKAFLEQVLRPGRAFAYREAATPQKLLTGRTARIVVTMGMPGWLFTLWYRAHGVKCLERNMLGFVGIRPMRRDVIGMVEQMGERRRLAWLARLREAGRRGE